MIKVVSFSEQFNNPVVLCLGNYESLHVGHAEIIARARSIAENVGAEVMMMTIDERDNPRFRGVILTYEERLARAEQLGVGSLLRIDFTEDFKSLTPQGFFNVLLKTLDVRAFVCGFDFRFGNQRSGDAALLTRLAGEADIPVCVVEKIERLGGKVATSAVKNALAAGDVSAANAMLGYSYFIEGRVEKGRMQGRQLGFPTANLDVQNGKFCAKKGVYQTKTTICGEQYRCITNVGAAPTFGFESPKIETHVIGYGGDLYGQTLKVEFVSYIRDIHKFSSIEELRAQLSADLESVRGEL